jgi:hypothetical protein
MISGILQRFGLPETEGDFTDISGDWINRRLDRRSELVLFVRDPRNEPTENGSNVIIGVSTAELLSQYAGGRITEVELQEGSILYYDFAEPEEDDDNIISFDMVNKIRGTVHECSLVADLLSYLFKLLSDSCGDKQGILTL